MTSSARERRYQAAFREYFVCAHTGTPYPCSQRDINETYDFSQDNQRALVSATRANREIVEHNEPRRPISSRERDAGRRILSALDEARLGHWGPDLITKCFLDLDTVFFGGVLRGNVRMDWDTWEQHIRPGDLGATGDPEPGRADIHLNAKMILLNHAEPLEAMFTVILHEMCVGKIISYVEGSFKFVK